MKNISINSIFGVCSLLRRTSRALLVLAAFMMPEMVYCNYFLWRNTDNIHETGTNKVPASQDGENKFYAILSGVPQNDNCYIAFTSTGDFDAVSTSTVIVTGDGQTNGADQPRGDHHFAYCKPKSTTIRVEFNTSTNTYTISLVSGSTVRVSTNIVTSGSGSFGSKTYDDVESGGSTSFTFSPADGYEYSTHSFTLGSGTCTKNGNVYSITNVSAEGTLSVTYSLSSLTILASVSGGNGTIDASSKNVTYNGSVSFTATPSSGYYVDQHVTTFDGLAGISYSVGANNVTTITLSNVRRAGSLVVVFTNSTAPVVRFGKYPTQSVSTANVSAYLFNNYCQTVSAQGFFWGTDKSKVTEATLASHDDATIFSQGTVSLVNGDSFEGSTDISGTVTTGTDVFFKAYVTAGGATGYSDVVGFFYNPCQGLTSIALSPIEGNTPDVQLPVGYSKDITVVARSAGRGASYKWYLDAADEDIISGSATAIEGADSYTYTFTMPDASSHSLKVKVTDNNCNTSQFTKETAQGTGITATRKIVISACTEPVVSFNADMVTTTTPWVPLTLSVTDSDTYSDYDWSITSGEAELTPASKTSATFRAGSKGTYVVTYTAIGNCKNADIKIEKSVTITVGDDSEKDCNP